MICSSENRLYIISSSGYCYYIIQTHFWIGRFLGEQVTRGSQKFSLNRSIWARISLKNLGIVLNSVYEYTYFVSERP